ncbi:MAG: hypothetical protein ABIQ18_43805, partial [Umezawaea sp.]
EMETAAQDYACFTNDLFSYQKEVEFEGEVHNIVVVVENFLEVDRLTARDVVAKLMTERMRQFEHIVANDLPRLFEEFDLDDSVRAILTKQADGLKEWMSGILEWHRKVVRYGEAELRRDRAASGLAPGAIGRPSGFRRPGFAVSGAGLPVAAPVWTPPSGPVATVPSASGGPVPSGPVVTTPSTDVVEPKRIGMPTGLGTSAARVQPPKVSSR